MEDLFDVSVKVEQPNQKSDNAAQFEFRPRARKAADKVYKATLRFLPFWKNPQSGSLVSKYTVFLENKMTGEKKELDDPSTVNEPSPFTQTFFDLRNSTDPILKENSKQFSRKLRYAALVQVLSCPSEPQLEGKILVYRFGTKIAALLDNETNPSNPNEAPVSPFSLVSGRYLFLKVIEKGGFDNTDESRFYDSKDDTTKVKCPVQTPTGIQYVPINADSIKNENFRAAVNEWLKSGPDLEQYQYHPLSDADREWAMNVINIARNPQASIAASQRAFQGGFGNGQPQAATPVSNDPLAGLNMGAAPMNPVAPQKPSADPLAGLQMGAPVQVPEQNAGFAASTGMPNLDDILGSATPAAAPKQDAPAAAPGGGIQLNDVLGDILG